MSPNTLAIRQHTTVVQSVQSATPYRGWFAHIAQLLCRLPFKPLCKPCKPCNCTHCTTTTADPADPANCALCGRCGKGRDQHQPRNDCRTIGNGCRTPHRHSPPKPPSRRLCKVQTAHLHFAQVRRLPRKRLGAG